MLWSRGTAWKKRRRSSQVASVFFPHFIPDAASTASALHSTSPPPDRHVELRPGRTRQNAKKCVSRFPAQGRHLRRRQARVSRVHLPEVLRWRRPRSGDENKRPGHGRTCLRLKLISQQGIIIAFVCHSTASSQQTSLRFCSMHRSRNPMHLMSEFLVNDRGSWVGKFPRQARLRKFRRHNSCPAFRTSSWKQLIMILFNDRSSRWIVFSKRPILSINQFRSSKPKTGFKNLVLVCVVCSYI